MLDAKNLHHAYVIEGNIEEALPYIQNFLINDLGVALIANIDYFEKKYDGFGIDDSREIKEMMLQRPINKYKIFVLAIPFMTAPSANALLKSLEEPPQGTHFFIIVPNSKRLLATLLSRVVLIKLKSELSAKQEEVLVNNQSTQIDITPKKFLSLSEDKRLAEVKNIMGLYDKDKIAKQDIISFLKEVLKEYRQKEKFDPNALNNAVTAFDYASDPSSSLKIILEYVSLILHK